ncbi:hypothetical protein SOVF_120860, partial [Spinacia oleracea]
PEVQKIASCVIEISKGI